VKKNLPRLLNSSTVGMLIVFSTAHCLSVFCSAQQLPTYNWAQINDLFLRSNPTLRAQ